MSVLDAFTTAQVESFFGHVKQAIIDSGFNVLTNSANIIEFIKAGCLPSTTGDDVPHWVCELLVDNSLDIRRIQFRAVSDLSVSVDRANGAAVWALSSGVAFGYGAGAHDVYFSCDGTEGWWWSATNGAGDTAGQFAAGSALRRYSADQSIGAHSRYCVIDRTGYLYFPWCKLPDGSRVIAPSHYSWTPIGEFGYGTPTRHTGSQLSRLAAPVWPQNDASYHASAVLGELTHVMALTDGFVQGDAPMPGWIAMICGQNASAFALPAPAVFNVVGGGA